MRTCPGCDADLTADWKYCIHCGVSLTRDPEPAGAGNPLTETDAASPMIAPAPVQAAAPATVATPTASVPPPPPAAATPAAQENPFPAAAPAATSAPPPAAGVIPGAIRPEAPAAPKRRMRIDLPLLIGIVLGVAGVVLLSYIGISIFGP